MASSARETVRQLRARAVGEVAEAGGFTAPVEVPAERAKRPEHGDFASNVALALGKAAEQPPRAVAEAIVARLLAAGEDWDRAAPRAAPRILLEYLSANPTGQVMRNGLGLLGVAAPEAMGRAGGDETTTKEDDA